MSGGSKGERARVKKTRQRSSTVAAMLEKPTLIRRACCVCATSIGCDIRPIQGSIGVGAISPKYDAPLICLECRRDKEKFYIARKAMLKFFGWEETFTNRWEG